MSTLPVSPAQSIELSTVVAEAVQHRSGIEAVIPASPFDPVSAGDVRVGTAPGATHDLASGVLSGSVVVVEYVAPGEGDPTGRKARRLNGLLGSDGSRAGRGAGLVGLYAAGRIIAAHVGQVSSTQLASADGPIVAHAYPVNLSALPAQPVVETPSPSAAAAAVQSAVRTATHDKVVDCRPFGEPSLRGTTVTVGVLVQPVPAHRLGQATRRLSQNDARTIAIQAIEGLAGRPISRVGRIERAAVTASSFDGDWSKLTVALDLSKG